MNHNNPLCNNCGACCRDHVPVAEGDSVPLELTYVDGDGRRWMKRNNVDPWCGALDMFTRRCTIYEDRPIACRNFEVDGHGCNRARLISARVIGVGKE